MSIDLSRVENILETMLGRSEIKEPAQSRVEELLIELKEAIEEGGTGGDITALTARIAKCERDISSIETVDETQTQQIQSIVTSLGEFRTAIENLDTDVENKADKSTTYTKTEVDTALSAKQDTISDLATIRRGATLGATAVQPISGKGLSTNDFTDAEKTKLDSHVADTNNPHQVTKAQVGLGNVDNVATKDVLAGLVDSGTKNLLNIAETPTDYHATAVINAPTGTVNVISSGAWARSAFPVTLPAGEYVFSVTVTLSSGTCRVQFNTAADGTGSGIGTPAINPSASREYTVNILLAESKSFYVMLYNNPSSNSDARTITYADLMICTKAAWDISRAYVPYRPSYDEIVARIEALERAGE